MEEINVVGVCPKCGLIYLFSGNFDEDDTGNLTEEILCDGCDAKIILEKEVQFI